MLLCSITFVRKNYFLNCRLGLTNVSLLCINLHLLVTHDKVLAKISPISNNRKLIFVFTNFFLFFFSFFQHWTQPIYKSRSKSSNFCQHYVFIQPKVIVEHWRHLNITKLFDQKDIDSNWSWMN